MSEYSIPFSFLTKTDYLAVKHIVSAHTRELWLEHLKQSLNH